MRRRYLMRWTAGFGLGVLLAGSVPAGADAMPAGDIATRAAYLMTAGDLRGDYGALADSSTNDFGRGALPSACNALVDGVQVIGKAAPSTMYSELDYPGGLMWQNTVFTYPSAARARVSFDQLRRRALAGCRGEAFDPYGDDFADVPNVNADAARALPPNGAWPRFVSASSHILLEPASAPPGYADNYGFGVFALVDNAIVQVRVYSTRPITNVARADAVHVAARVSERYAESR
jgi:hypothetical protein